MACVLRPPAPNARTDAYAKVRSSEAAEVARNQAYIINDLQLGLPRRVAVQLEEALLGPYLHLLTFTSVDKSKISHIAMQQPQHRRGINQG
jgi:hypothetical protein